jgi:hypothetical protein
VSALHAVAAPAVLISILLFLKTWHPSIVGRRVRGNNVSAVQPLQTGSFKALFPVGSFSLEYQFVPLPHQVTPLSQPRPSARILGLVDDHVPIEAMFSATLFDNLSLHKAQVVPDKAGTSCASYADSKYTRS